MTTLVDAVNWLGGAIFAAYALAWVAMVGLSLLIIAAAEYWLIRLFPAPKVSIETEVRQ